MEKNIAFLIRNLQGGGAERVVSRIATHLSQYDNFKVYLILFDETENKYEIGKSKIIDLNIAPKTTYLGKLYNVFKRKKETEKIVKTYQINTLISFLPGPNLVNYLVNVNHVKKIVSIRKFIELKGFNLFLQKRIVSHVDHVVTVSKKIEMEYEVKTGATNLITIYNPYPVKDIQKLSTQDINPKYEFLFNDQVVINIGRLCFQKGQWHLIRAFSEVVKSFPEAKLIILGEGELKDYLVQLIAKLNLPDNVFILNFQSNPYPFLHRSSLFVLSSYFEGLPNAIIEAMVCGVPIISTDCKSGPREILAPNTSLNDVLKQELIYGTYGILIPNFTSNKYLYDEPLTSEESFMSNVIIKNLKHPEIINQYKEQSLKRVEDFQIVKIINKWEHLLK